MSNRSSALPIRSIRQSSLEMSDDICDDASRRKLLVRSFTCAALATTALASSTTLVFAEPAPAGPSAADLELADLGLSYRQLDAEGARAMEARARAFLNEHSTPATDWETARAAAKLLTAPERVAAEFDAADATFVGGWLLSHSELGVALVFAAVKTSNAGNTTGPDTE